MPGSASFSGPGTRCQPGHRPQVRDGKARPQAEDRRHHHVLESPVQEPLAMGKTSFGHPFHVNQPADDIRGRIYHASARPGSQTENVEPQPGSLRTVIRP